MATEPEFKITVRTVVDEPSFSAAAQAQQRLSEATKQNIDLAKQQAAQGTGTSATPLADAFVQRIKDSGGLAKEMGTLKESASAASGSLEGMATGVLPKLAGGLAIAGAAVTALKQLFDTLLANNAELAKEWEATTKTLSQSWSSSAKEIIGNGDGLKEWFQTLTRSMGGTTGAQQEINKAVAEFIPLADKQKTLIEGVTQALHDQAEAAKNVRERMKTLYAEEDAQKQAARESEDKDREAKREAIEKDASLTPEDKAARLKGFDRETGLIDRTRRTDDIRTNRERQAADLKVSQQEVNAAEELAKKQTENAAKLRAYQTAAAGAAQAKERGDSTNAASLEKQQREAFNALPKDLRDRIMNIDADAQKAKASGGDEKEITAKQDKDRQALIDQQAKAAEDSRKAAREAVKKRDALAEKQTQDDAKNKVEESRVEDEQKRDDEQAEKDRQAREQQRRDGQSERNFSKSQDDDIARLTKELREAGRGNNRKAVIEAQARLNRAKAAKAAKDKQDAESGAGAEQTEMPDDVAFYDDDGNPVLYSDLDNGGPTAPQGNNPPSPQARNQARSNNRRRDAATPSPVILQPGGNNRRPASYRGGPMPQASAETEGADGAMREGQSAMRELSRQLSDFAGEMSTAVRSFSKERKQVARELSELVSHSQGMNLREAQLRVQLAMQNDRMAAQRVGTFAP